MTSRRKRIYRLCSRLLPTAFVYLLTGCGAEPAQNARNIETGIALNNLNSRYYVALQVRPSGAASRFATTALLPPGGTVRERFIDLFGLACPDAVDLQIFLYQRINEDLPIGLDEGEAVNATPVAADALFDVPLCAAGEVVPSAVVETFTVTLWESSGEADRVKLAQGTPLEEVLLDSGLLSNESEALWEFTGVTAGLDLQPPPPPAESIEISGRALLLPGDGQDADDEDIVSGIGVLIRPRFRNRTTDDNETNDTDAGFGAPIDVRETDAEGRFSFRRPPGVYRIEFFSDRLTFRPAVIDVEAPAGEIISLVETIP